MKKIYLSAISLKMLLTELPLIILLTLSIIFNNSAPAPFRLYPMIIIISAAIIFILIYLFRVVVISREEIKIIGPYSSRDKVIINKGKTLILTLKKRGGLTVSLFGSEGRPALDWAAGDDFVPMEITLFKERTYAGRSGVKKILRYFDVPLAEEIANGKDGSFEYKDYTVNAVTEDGKRTIEIKFTNTI